MTGTVQWLQAGGIGVGTWVIWAVLAKLAIDGPPQRFIPDRTPPMPAPVHAAPLAEQLDIPVAFPTPPATQAHDQTLQLHEVLAYRRAPRHAKGRPTC